MTVSRELGAEEAGLATRKPMNKKDMKDLEAILVRLDEQDTYRLSQIEEVKKELADMSVVNEKSHKAIAEDIQTINTSLLDPKKGLWAETSKNTWFRETMSHAMWIIIPAISIGVGGGIVALILFFGPAMASTQ